MNRLVRLGAWCTDGRRIADLYRMRVEFAKDTSKRRAAAGHEGNLAKPFAHVDCSAQVTLDAP